MIMTAQFHYVTTSSPAKQIGIENKLTYSVAVYF